MPPAPLDTMTVSDPQAPPRGAAGAPGAPLVPLLAMEEGAPDPVALATWHLALSGTTGVEVPHDLFALWLFPSRGGALLLGPEALAADQVTIPLPTPHLDQGQLFQLEEVLRRARYTSAMAVPVRTPDRDVGVILLGSFVRGAYGPLHALALGRLAAGLAAPLRRLAAVLPAATPNESLEPALPAGEMPAHLAAAAAESPNGPDLVRRVSGLLYALLPHDRLEILVPGPGGSAFVALSGSGPRRRWNPSGGGVEPYAALVERFGAEATLLLENLAAANPDAEWSLGTGTGAAHPARGILGARLEVGRETVGFLLLASVASDAYRPEDEETLALAARFLAPRVAGLRLAAEVEELRMRARSTGAPELSLLRAMEALAHEGHLGAALARFSAGLGEVLPHSGLSVQLRRGEAEVIAVDPDALRPLADLPGIPADQFGGASVLDGTREWAVQSVAGGEEVILPLIVAGRIVGTLGIRSGSFASTHDAAALARPFAELLAPHLELLRRGASPTSPAPRERSPVR